jgi:hypothetical protein
MAGLAEVFAGVLMRARVAAADVPTRQAHPQVSPGVNAVFFAVPTMPRCAGFGFGGIGSGLEVFTRFDDRRGASIAPA